MDYLAKTTISNQDGNALRQILDESLKEDDFFSPKARSQMTKLGLPHEEALMLLARHKSRAVYGCELSEQTLTHLFDLARKRPKEKPFISLMDSPFFLIKSCWVYDHAPYFFFCGEDETENRDSQIIDFARHYETDFLKSRVDYEKWERTKRPKRVRATTFWENKTFDPLLLIAKVRDENLEGIEISIDFHPFNYTNLLPEELSPARRAVIREASLKGGVKIDIHSPIVGPYTPSPNPSKGKQRFFDPARCLEVQYQTIDLAKDIGAGAVVFHLISPSRLKELAGLVERAAGSDVRVTIENYCQTGTPQTSDTFIACVDEILASLPKEAREKNFGITLDVGHFNIEGEDPLVAAERVGKWCLDKKVFLRVHATDNYGNLLFSPPVYSADVHSNVSGRGINNALIIKLLRSMGHHFEVVAEQIQPLKPEDVSVIHQAQTSRITKSYHDFVDEGRHRLSGAELGALIGPEIIEEPAYQFLTGIQDLPALREYLVYRKIQDKKYLSVEEAKRISQEFMRMPRRIKSDLTTYIDDLLLPVQAETGTIQKSELDLICQNISGALFGTISNEHLNLIFSPDRIYRKGDVICRQGEAGHEMYFIKKGEVEVHINGACLACMGPGEIFGEISLFYNINRSATIKAFTEHTVVGVLSRRGLEGLFKDSLGYAHDLIYRLYNILPERLRNLNDKYKAAIRTLHLIFDGREEEMPSVEHLQGRISGEKVEFLPTLAQDEKTAIYQRVKTLNANQAVFAEGDHGDGAYFIIEGRVKVVGLSSDFQEILIGELGEGEIFGEMALIDDKPRSASVVTLTSCKVAFIERKAFNEFIQTGSDLAVRFMGFICLSLFRRILRLDSLYSDIKKRIRNH